MVYYYRAVKFLLDEYALGKSARRTLDPLGS
ncbi:MAG: hypothetical protein BMS9Abin05_0326 [Rhodothermia bacterium]|nr:MAG: hypothetical protein BMS9Abin05_0326 [Rhodothermia bacterium]